MLSVGNEIGALIIPVGLAYQEAYRQRPGIKLQMGYDGSHPTVAGQYLAGAVVYGSLYGKSPVGNPYDYFGALDQDTKDFRADASRMKRCGNSLGATRGACRRRVVIRRGEAPARTARSAHPARRVSPNPAGRARSQRRTAAATF